MNFTSSNFVALKSLITVAVLSVLAATVAGPACAQSVAYTGATIETMGEDGRLENATLIVADGKVTDVGTDVEVPDDARVVRLTGKTIMPGIIDPYHVFKSTAATSNRTIVFRGRTIVVGGGPFTAGPFVRVGEFFDPFDLNFNPAKRTGITTANLVTDGRGLSALASLTDEAGPEMLFQNNGLMFAKVTNQTSALDVIRKPLVPSKKKTTKKPDSDDKEKKLTPTQEIAKFWEDVKKGESPLLVNVNNDAAVAYVLQIADKYEKLKLVLVATGPNLYQLLDQIQESKNVSVVLQPGIDRVPFSADLMNVSRMLADREIPFCISMSLSKSQTKR